MAGKCFIFCFDDVEVRQREFTLTKAGKVVHLEPRAFRALLSSCAIRRSDLTRGGPRCSVISRSDWAH
jgi:hypothetical protein